MHEEHIKVLGIRFYCGQLGPLLDRAESAGLVVAPSAPVLADVSDDAHWNALQAADVAITDSGFLILLWGLMRGRLLPRITGLRFLRELIRRPELRRKGSSFWIMPSEEEGIANIGWLERQGIDVGIEDWMVAPAYPRGPLSDGELLATLERRRPTFIFINLGGGVQERLGHFLKQRLSWRPTIVCTGAAIAFFSGQQASIPSWADRVALGWLFRVVGNPRRFIPRYWRALSLAGIVWRNGPNPPEIGRARV
jgi:UDP-N-acetyl-D-mannosaminuronic acid transferase (WecB/TagA/CpsF family)